MKSKWYKLTSLLVMLALLMTACGGDDEATEAPKATEPAAAEPTEAPAEKPTEKVTLISCWPFATNAHRIVVIAVPSPKGDGHAD